MSIKFKKEDFFSILEKHGIVLSNRQIGVRLIQQVLLVVLKDVLSMVLSVRNQDKQLLLLRVRKNKD